MEDDNYVRKMQAYAVLAQVFPTKMEDLDTDQLTVHLNNPINQMLAWNVFREKGFTVEPVDSLDNSEDKYLLKVSKNRV